MTAPAVLHLPGRPSALGRPGPHLVVREGPTASTPSLLAAAAGAGGRLRHRHRGFVRLEVFSVDPCSIQLHWSASAPGTLRFGAGDVEVAVEATPPSGWAGSGRAPGLGGGPGSVVIDGLPADTVVPVWARSAAGRVDLGEVRTLPRPPGRLLASFATVTDLHVGESRFGPGRIEDRWPLPEGGAYSLRSATAAIDEALAWGATHLVVKGDMTHDTEPGEFELVGRMLASLPVGVDVVLGNHDMRHGVDAAALLSGWGLVAGPATRTRDLAGVRVVLVHSPTSRDHWGVLDDDQVDQVTSAVRGAGPCVVVAHHPPLTAAVTTHYPPGMRPGPSRRLLSSLAASNPATVVVSGHTHRNRVRWSDGIVCAETGPTKAHPGGWTGYRVYEGGIVQTSRRTARPDVIAWTEQTAGLLARQWGRWSPGALADRCWTLDWPT